MLLIQPLEQRKFGMTLRPWRAMSGYVGLHLGKKWKREIFVSERQSQSLKAECAGHAAGLAALIAKKNTGKTRFKMLILIYYY
jgi:hypothetical protein